MDVTVPFDPGAAGLVLVQASPELTSNMSFPFYKPVWTSTESLYLHSLYLYSRFLYSIHHSQSSQSISIYDRGIGAKISVSISISRFLRLENLLYTKEYRLEGPRRRPDNIGQSPMEKMLSPVLPSAAPTADTDPYAPTLPPIFSWTGCFFCTILFLERDQRAFFV